MRMRIKTMVKPESKPRILIRLNFISTKIAKNNRSNRVMLRSTIFAVDTAEPINPSTLRTNPRRFNIPSNPPVRMPKGSFFHSKKDANAAAGIMIKILF